MHAISLLTGTSSYWRYTPKRLWSFLFPFIVDQASLYFFVKELVRAEMEEIKVCNIIKLYFDLNAFSENYSNNYWQGRYPYDIRSSQAVE